MPKTTPVFAANSSASKIDGNEQPDIRSPLNALRSTTRRGSDQACGR
jgi:hypothetical protein